MLNPLNPLTNQKSLKTLMNQRDSLFPVGGENNGIGSLSNPSPVQPPANMIFQQPTSFTLGKQLPSMSKQPIQNPNGIQPIQNPTTNSVNDLNIMVDNILKEKLKEFFGGIMSMFDV